MPRPNKLVSTLIRSDGRVERSEQSNLRVNSGTNWQANHMGSANIAPIQNIALTEDATAPAVSDVSLTDELTADGLSRTTASFSHTADQSLYTLSASYQYTGSSTVTVAKVSTMHDSERTQAVQSTDTMFTESLLGSVAVMTSNDTLSIDWGHSI